MSDVLALLLIVAGIVVPTLGWAIWQQRVDAERSRRHSDRQTFLLGTLITAVSEHGDTLRLRLRQLRYQDPYGRWVYDKCQKELGYFFFHFVRPDLVPIGITHAEEEQLMLALFAWAEDADLDCEAGQPAPNAGDGIGYERHVAALLTQVGYEVSFTPSTGDQGVDLLARHGEESVAIQCKNYSGPVGNDAIQQVYAGARFHGADLALVVAPNGFTTAARQLAASLRVACLHHDEVPTHFNKLAKPA